MQIVRTIVKIRPDNPRHAEPNKISERSNCKFTMICEISESIKLGRYYFPLAVKIILSSLRFICKDKKICIITNGEHDFFSSVHL